MKRRHFLGSAAGLGFAVMNKPDITNAAMTAHWDFLIIGAGTAGLMAAYSAARRNARVLLIDSADKVGGTLHMAFGQIAAAGTRVQAAKGIIDDTPDKHFIDVMTVSRGLADPAIIRRTVENAPATLNWLLDHGLTPLPDHPLTGDNPGHPAYTTPRYFWGANAGRDILTVVQKQLAPALASDRITLQLNTRATAFIVGRNGAIEGVHAEQNGRVLELKGRHILIATGGYAMNPTLFEELNGCPAYVAGSYPTNQGDALAMTTAIGGQLRGYNLHRPGAGSILTSETFPAKVYARFNTAPQIRQPWEIWVNNFGKRYVREDEPLSYERERALVKQPRQRYVIVFDDAIFKAAPPGIPGWTRDKMAAHFGTHPMFQKAGTIDELAANSGVDAAGLHETIEAYNDAVNGASDPLGREHKPLTIAQPPFYAVIHHGHSATSPVGITVDSELRVTRADGSPIPNLYAAGEVLGSGVTLGAAFVPGMMLTPALTLGRWLGETLPIGI